MNSVWLKVREVISKYYFLKLKLPYDRNSIAVPYMDPLRTDGDKLKVLYQSDNFLAVDKVFDQKINSDDPEEYTLATQMKLRFPDLWDSNYKVSSTSMSD